MKTSMALKTLLGAASMALPLMAFGESNVQTGAGTLNATAHVDFQIVIPRILYLRVGAGTSYTTGVLSPSNVAVDQIVFNVPGASLGTGVAQAATSGGDAGLGVETAAIVGNGGNVTLVATTAGALNNGVATQTIPYTQITTTAATITSATALPAPVLANGASNTVTVTAVNGVAFQDATWTYKFANNLAPTPAAGTYGGGGVANVNNGRVTYTATML
ncbi:MAG: hypothetical protein ACLPX1_06050 [Steroidobacteraceae bacterium]